MDILRGEADLHGDTRPEYVRSLISMRGPAGVFIEGLAAVMMGAKWGYIDTTGKMVIQPMPLMRAEDFHHGLAFVSTKDGKYGYIDKSGKYVWTPTLLCRN